MSQRSVAFVQDLERLNDFIAWKLAHPHRSSTEYANTVEGKNHATLTRRLRVLESELNSPLFGKDGDLSDAGRAWWAFSRSVVGMHSIAMHVARAREYGFRVHRGRKDLTSILAAKADSLARTAALLSDSILVDAVRLTTLLDETVEESRLRTTHQKMKSLKAQTFEEVRVEEKRMAEEEPATPSPRIILDANGVAIIEGSDLSAGSIVDAMREGIDEQTLHARHPALPLGAVESVAAWARKEFGRGWLTDEDAGSDPS